MVKAAGEIAPQMTTQVTTDSPSFARRTNPISEPGNASTERRPQIPRKRILRLPHVYLTHSENNHDVATGRDGSCYIIGSTQSFDFPMKNAYQSIFGGGIDDVYVAKFSSKGSLLWCTYLGGSGDFDIGYGITVSGDGSCYVTGETTSRDFPIKLTSLR